MEHEKSVRVALGDSREQIYMKHIKVGIIYFIT